MFQPFIILQLTANSNYSVWNGSTGGVTVINAVNQLDLNGKTINAAGAGFRGGAGRQLGGAAGLNQVRLCYPFIRLLQMAVRRKALQELRNYVNNNGSMLNTGVEGYPNGSYGRGAPGNAGGGGTDYDPSSNDQNDWRWWWW